MDFDDDLTRRPGVEALSGEIVEQLPRALFRVRFADGSEALAHVTERRAKDFLRLLPGDRVSVRLSPHDNRRGRIVRRESR